MKQYLTIAVAALLAAAPVLAQEAPDSTAAEEKGFVFSVQKEIPVTSIKNQNHSGTCWAFSSLGFFEAELLRQGKGEVDLAEMFLVHKTMEDRAQMAVRLHGDVSYSPGGSFYDAVYCWRNYGMVPQEAMPGIMYGDTLPNHDELDAVAGGYVQAIAKSDMKKLSPVWQKGLSAIYDVNFPFLGQCLVRQQI